jgi:hypothetical protein
MAVEGRTSVLVDIAHIEVAEVESAVALAVGREERYHIVQEVDKRLCLVQVLVQEAVSARLYMVGVLEVWSLRPQTVVVAVVTKTSGSMFPLFHTALPFSLNGYNLSESNVDGFVTDSRTQFWREAERRFDVFAWLSRVA